MAGVKGHRGVRPASTLFISAVIVVLVAMMTSPSALPPGQRGRGCCPRDARGCGGYLWRILGVDHAGPHVRDRYLERWPSCVPCALRRHHSCREGVPGPPARKRRRCLVHRRARAPPSASAPLPSTFRLAWMAPPPPAPNSAHALVALGRAGGSAWDGWRGPSSSVTSPAPPSRPSWLSGLRSGARVCASGRRSAAAVSSRAPRRSRPAPTPPSPPSPASPSPPPPPPLTWNTMRSAVKGVGLSVAQMSFLWVLHKAARARGGAHFPWRDFQRLAATHPKRPLCAPAKASGVACSRGAELSKLWVHHKALCKREQRSARPHVPRRAAAVLPPRRGPRAHAATRSLQRRDEPARWRQ